MKKMLISVWICLAAVLLVACGPERKPTAVNELKKNIEYPGPKITIGSESIEGIKAKCQASKDVDPTDCTVKADVAYAKYTAEKCSGGAPDLAVYGIGGHLEAANYFFAPTIVKELDKLDLCYEIYSVRNVGYCVAEGGKKECTKVTPAAYNGSTGVFNARMHLKVFNKLSESIPAEKWIIDGRNFGATVVYEMIVGDVDAKEIASAEEKATLGKVRAFIMQQPMVDDFMSGCADNWKKVTDKYDPWYKEYENAQGAQAYWLTKFIYDESVFDIKKDKDGDLEDESIDFADGYCTAAEKTKWNMARYWKRINALGIWFKVYVLAAKYDDGNDADDVIDAFTDWDGVNLHDMGYGCVVSLNDAGHLGYFDYPDILAKVYLAGERKVDKLGYTDSDDVFHPCKWLGGKK